MPERALVDRLVRGRAWIPVLGLMLAGIVAMQVELLKLNSAIGHGIDRSSTLQSQNEQLRASVARLADDQRIEGLAAHMGMVMPSPDSVVFVTPNGGGDVQQAVAKMRPPDSSAISALQAAQPIAAQIPSSLAAASPSPGAASGNPSQSPSTGTTSPAATSGASVALASSPQTQSTATGN